MVEYSEYRLGSLCNRFSSGKGIPADLINETGKYPVIGGNGLRGYTDTYNFDGECAVIGRQGAYCGNVQFFSGKGYMTEHAVVTQPNSANNAKYLTYKLNGLSLGRFSGQAAQPGLSVTKLARLRIEMPPKWYQDKVAGILYAYDNLIEVNNKRIKVLEQMAENLYKEWFVRFRFPGHETSGFENGIPKGWNVCRFSSIANVLSGGTPSTDHDEYYGGNIPFYTPKDSSDDYFVFDTISKLTEEGLQHCNSQLYPKNTIMITARGTVGNLNLLAKPMAMNQSCYALTSNTIPSQYFLFFLIKREILKLRKMASGGVFDTIIVSTFDHIKVTIPDKSLIMSFDMLVSPILDETYTLLKQNRNLIRQRDLLLPRLMSGKLEV